MAHSLRMTRGSGDLHNHALISAGMLVTDLLILLISFATLALSPSRFPEAFQQQIQMPCMSTAKREVIGNDCQPRKRTPFIWCSPALFEGRVTGSFLLVKHGWACCVY